MMEATAALSSKHGGSARAIHALLVRSVGYLFSASSDHLVAIQGGLVGRPGAAFGRAGSS